MIVAGEMRKQARENLKDKWGKAVIIALLFTILTGVIGGLAKLTETDDEEYYFDEYSYMSERRSSSNDKLIILGLVFSVVELLISVPLSYGLVGAYMKLKKGEEVPAYEAITFGFKNFGRSWGVSLQVLLKLLVPIIIFIVAVVVSAILRSLGSIITILLSVVLIIAACFYMYTENLKYALANYVAIDEPELSSDDVVKKSKELMKDHRADFFVLTLSFIGWSILAAFTLGIGMLWLMPYIQFSQICFYEKTKAEKEI